MQDDCHHLSFCETLFFEKLLRRRFVTLIVMMANESAKNLESQRKPAQRVIFQSFVVKIWFFVPKCPLLKKWSLVTILSTRIYWRCSRLKLYFWCVQIWKKKHLPSNIWTNKKFKLVTYETSQSHTEEYFQSLSIQEFHSSVILAKSLGFEHIYWMNYCVLPHCVRLFACQALKVALSDSPSH